MRYIYLRQVALLKLDIEKEEVLELIGFQSNWSEHKLVWALNKSLGLRLKRLNDYVLENKEMSRGALFSAQELKYAYSVYHYESEEEQVVLVANIAEGKALYSVGRAFDYLLRINGNQPRFVDLDERLANHRAVLAIGHIRCDTTHDAAAPFNALD
jgi:hypothetical protein